MGKVLHLIARLFMRWRMRQRLQAICSSTAVPRRGPGATSHPPGQLKPFFGGDERWQDCGCVDELRGDLQRCHVEPFAWFRDVLSRIIVIARWISSRALVNLPIFVRRSPRTL